MKWIAPEPIEITPSGTASWQDVVVSDYVSGSATGIIVTATNQDSAAAYDVGFRKNGSTDGTFEIQASGIRCIPVGIDGSDIVELYRESPAIRFFLIGYFESESVFFTNANSTTPGTLNTWNDIDISSETGGDTATGVYGYALLGANNTAIRKKGSTDGVSINPHSYAGYFIGVDANEVYQVSYGGWTSPTQTVYRTGYCTQDMTFDTNATDLTDLADDSWVMNQASSGIGGFVYFSGGNQRGARSYEADADLIGNPLAGMIATPFDVAKRFLVFAEPWSPLSTAWFRLVGTADGTPATAINVPHAQFQIQTGVPPMAQTSGISLQTLNDEGFYTSNALINGDFLIAQRGTSFDSTTTPANNDDTYLLDRWKLYSDGNDIVDVDQETSDLPSGSRSAIKMTVATANKKFAVAQFIEAKNCAHLIGGKVSLSFHAQTSTGSSIGNIRATVIAWSGTADSITSDIISAWGSAGSNPTLVANCTYENIPANLAVSDSWASYSIEDIDIDTASTKNLIVLIWVDDTDAAASDELYVTQVQLEKGASASVFEVRDPTDEMLDCQRYFRANVQGRVAAVQSAATVRIGVRYDPPMRTAPSLTFIDELRVHQGTSNFSSSSGSIGSTTLTEEGGDFAVTGFSGLTGGGAATVQDSTADRLFQDAEL